MAAEYEVNIKLNTQQVERELKKIESGVKKVGQTEKQSANSTDRRVAAMVKLRSIGNDIAALADKGLDVSKAQFQVKKASEAIDKKMFLTANSRMGVALKELNVQRGITKQLEQQEKARLRQRSKRAEGVALGAGFPLLFGGGPGAVLGGAAGGLTGSFGAQIALSAIGQQVDKFVAGMIDAGKALTSVGGAADFMAEKSLFSSDAMQFRIERLIQEGKVTKAAALMTQEMAKQVGGTGLKALKDLGTEADKMGKLFGTVMLRIQAFIAQALTPLLKIINRAVGGLTAQSQLDQMIAEAGSPERGAQILARSRELRGVKRHARTGKALGLNQLTPEIIKTLQSEFPALIPEGAGIDPTELEVLQAQASASSGLNRKSKLPDLEAEREKLESLLRLEEKRFELELKSDEAAIARLQADEKIIQIFEKIRDIQSSGLTDEEREIALQNQSLEIARVNLELQYKLADIEQDRIAKVGKNFEDQMAHQEELRQKINDQESAYKALNDTFRTGIVDSILAAIEGTESLKDSLLGVIKSMARLILQQQLMSALSGFNLFGGGGGGTTFQSPEVLTSGIQFFANGGTPPVGRPSIVGEKGPELFVPKTAGTIVPNHAMGGSNVVVNVDASGSSVQGDGQQAKALGQAIGAAVQAEIIKQKMPGGLLS